MKGHGHLNKSKSQMGRVREAFPANLIEHASKRSESVPYSNKEVTSMSIKDSANMLFVQAPKLLKPQGQFEKTNTALQLERSTNFDGVLNPSLQQEQQLLYGLNSKRLAIMQELKNDQLIEGNYKERLEQELKMLNDKLNPKSEIDKLIEAIKQQNNDPVKSVDEVKKDDKEAEEEEEKQISRAEKEVIVLGDLQDNKEYIQINDILKNVLNKKEDIKNDDMDFLFKNKSMLSTIFNNTEDYSIFKDIDINNLTKGHFGRIFEGLVEFEEDGFELNNEIVKKWFSEIVDFHKTDYAVNFDTIKRDFISKNFEKRKD
jgi:hypothetical protein